eukprot:CAMPEP_0180518914 /NCGR_PEP_ID=MMETSP1036_2-20121128/55380_1 /TAXON_ID=632150 /ORGANISM="Azadinium spinosum, Strain 3D9" /LENGTH=118 /DNA_ID=CAMNT_0022531161 /DNA_START=405 /DNA_END=762 /DNA_ORIENTATION=-
MVAALKGTRLEEAAALVIQSVQEKSQWLFISFQRGQSQERLAPAGAGTGKVVIPTATHDGPSAADIRKLMAQIWARNTGLEQCLHEFPLIAFRALRKKGLAKCLNHTALCHYTLGGPE